MIGMRQSESENYNYYWRIGAGNEFISTETSDPVYLPNYWFQEMKVMD